MALGDDICTFNLWFGNMFDIKYNDGKEKESAKINKRLAGFDPEKSEVMKILKYHFSTGVTHNELLSIAKIICLQTNLKIDRLATRDQRVLIKWFDENWSSICMIIPLIHILDENKIPITLNREIDERFKSKK